MIMKNIVVGYNGGITGKDALAQAKEQSKALNAKVHVVESRVGKTHTDSQDIMHSKEDLEFAETYLKKQNIPCETHLLVRGVKPGEDIVQFAEENLADLIIVGVRRRSKVGKLIFGSTAQFVILNAPCPVMTVR